MFFSIHQKKCCGTSTKNKQGHQSSRNEQQSNSYYVCVISVCPNRHATGASVRTWAAGREKSWAGGAGGVKSGAAGAGGMISGAGGGVKSGAAVTGGV